MQEGYLQDEVTNMRKYDIDSINLKLEEVVPCLGGITFCWSSDIGFGQYTIHLRPAEKMPEARLWVAESEGMDKLNDKAFGEKLMELWMKQILVIE